MKFLFAQRPFILLTAALLFPLSSKGSQVLTLTENKRLEAPICPDSMNRIAVANDRITQIFGDDGTFESQNDENTGQVFLKPTAENGTKSLSLTLVTEQGVTQDLTLKPTAKSVTTLIFKNNTPTQDVRRAMGQEIPEAALNPSGSNPYGSGSQPEHTSTPQDHLLALLKKAVMGRLPLQEDGSLSTTPSRPGPEGFHVSPYQSYASGPYSVHTFHVENTMETPIEVQEKSFFQPGDLAITLQRHACQRRLLPPGGKILLYVARLKEMASLEGGSHD